jgi:hypothetical protein
MAAGNSSLYEFLSGFILGFHGTKKNVAEKVLAGKDVLRKSANYYDWLGTGIYFWESSPSRAYEFALESFARRNPAHQSEVGVVGAIIDPGKCLNLLEASAIAQVKQAYKVVRARFTGRIMPRNQGGKDLLKRHLDCAVIQTLHEIRAEASAAGNGGVLPQYQTVRAAFREGNPLYPDAGFHEKTHIQIAVRDLSCIKGYFRPL